MKKIGMIGGLGWPSTLDYYRLLCIKSNEHFRAQGVEPPLPTPPIVIESLNMNETRGLRGQEGDDASWQRFETVFRSAFLRLKNAGADFGMIASNTPHMRLKGIRDGLDFPIVSILDTTTQTVSALNGKRVLVLGTTVTMKSPVYSETLMSHGIGTIDTVMDEEIALLGKVIDVDLYQDKIGDSRNHIIKLCEKHVSDPVTDIVCLACTELPLAFPEHQNAAYFEADGFSFVNTTVAHVDSALNIALSSKS